MCEMLERAITELNCINDSDGSGSQLPTETAVRSGSELVEGEDYYSDGDAIVFTERYHLRRGHCCDNRCRHCPYGLAAPKEKSADP